MPPAIIELNDIAIAFHYREQKVLSPGYALLTNTGVTTGNKARARAWLDPQHSFNQYWHQLSMAPLGISNRHARHFADLAYSQLQQALHQLEQEAGQPKDVIFSVPGSFSHEQLAILLGLAKACGLEAIGLVDSAICAIAHSSATNDAAINTAVHLDIQLHNAVLTTISCDKDIRRETVSPFIGLGLKNLEDAWVQTMANRFIGEYRYDPLHTAAGEQSLRDQLPGWLDELQDNSEITVGLATPSGELRLNLSRHTFVEVAQEKLEPLARAAIEASGKSNENATGTIITDKALLLSHRLAALPGIIELFPTAIALTADSALRGCLAHRDTITNESTYESTNENTNSNTDDNRQVALVTSLPLMPTPAPSKTTASDLKTSTAKTEVTHLLHQHQAYAIDPGLRLQFNDGELIIAPFDPQNSAPEGIFLSRDQQQLTLTTDQNIHCSGDIRALKAGDKLNFNGITLELIQVL